MELASFYKMSEMFDSKVDSQYFSVKSTVLDLSGLSFVEKANRPPMIINRLLQNCTHCYARCISHDIGCNIQFRVKKQSSVC